MNDVDALDWDDLLDGPITFARLADPIPAQFRPERRIALCLLLIDKSWGARAGWKALHVLNWAVQQAAHIDVLRGLRNPASTLDRPIVRFEPALDRALDLGVGLGFIERRGLNYELSDEGRHALQQIQDSGAFRVEIDALRQIKGKVSGKEVEQLLEWRTS